MFVTIEDVVGHIAWANHSARHDARDLFARASESEYRSGEDGFTVGTLRQRTGGFVGLRIVKNDKRRSDRFAVGTFELHTADASGEAGDFDDRSTCLAVCDRRQDDFFRRPADLGSLAIE